MPNPIIAHLSPSSLSHRFHNLPKIPPAILLAIPLPYIALLAKLLAWLNLSHRENATVFVMVRTSAMTTRESQVGDRIATMPRPTHSAGWQ